jgi:uncharacterized protein (TIGR00290 family)
VENYLKKEKVLISWSGGKDSAFALYEIQENYSLEVVALVTSVTEDYGRVSMHGVRQELLMAQADSLGLPLEVLFITRGETNTQYEEKLQSLLERYAFTGVSAVIFGDIFLQDLREYREKNLSKIGMKGIFPLWNRKTELLSRSFITSGFKAVVTCIDSEALGGIYVGRTYDHEFLSSIPSSVDPCGENGEFHSFVYDGPIFKRKIEISTGEVVVRDDRFFFCDLLPV